MKPALLALIGACLLVAFARAGTVSLQWDANPADEHVTEYRIYRIEDLGPVLLATSTTPSATVGAVSGQRLAIAAFNGQESAFSTIVTVPALSTPSGLRVVEIQTSDNLRDWHTLTYVPLDSGQPSQFIRTRITSTP